MQNACYLFVGDHTNHPNTTIGFVNNDVTDSNINPYLQMIMGKRLTVSNFVPAILNYPYIANTVFAMYDDQDLNLSNEIYYTIVNQGGTSYIYKCLDNNQGNTSTVQPDFSQITGSNTILYQTADGYRWKYMYTVDTTTASNTATATYFPLLPNTTVMGSATAGAIDVCKVILGGSLYNNWTFGTFKTTDLTIGGDPTLFNLSNNQISTTNGYYNDCVLYLTSGPAIGQFAVVNNYFTNSVGNFIRLVNSFPITPTNGTTFQIYPQYRIQGKGTEIQQPIARALVNSTSSNSIYRIEVLQRGIGFSNIISSFVSANSIVGVSVNAIVRPILPPPGGHGFNQGVELGANNLIIWGNLNDTESNTILAINQYQQIGLLYNPTFSNAHLTLSFASFPFNPNELVYLINPLQVQASANVASGNNYLQATTGAFQNQFVANQQLLLVGANSNFSQLVVVNNVVNATYLNLTSNVNFSCTNVVVYNPNIYGNCYVGTINSLTDLYVVNCSPTIATGAQLVGSISGAYAIISTVARNDVSKSTNTFIQLNKYSITTISGSFIPNEVVVQSNVTALYHSSNATTLYLSNLNGVIGLSGTNLIGQTSGAIAQVTKVYPQELLFSTGEILYVENISAITRQPNQTEAFRLVMNF